MLPNRRMPSVMGHRFSDLPQANIQRSSFKRSHGHKTAFDSGFLVPVYVDEALPGDTFKMNVTSIARLATPIVPFMDNLHVDFHFFAVPNRLVWENFQKFMGEQANPNDSIDFLVPQISAPGTGWLTGSMANYFGIPYGYQGNVNALHFRAYNLIWNEWFRDQNLQDSVVVDKDDGPDSSADYVLLRRGKRHDYFTSCLPWPQKGVQIDLPLGSTAPVIGDGNSLGLTDGGSNFGLLYDAGPSANRSAVSHLDQSLPFSGAPSTFPLDNFALGLSTDPNLSNVIADLSNATAASINSLREAFQLQIMLERDARGGTRYTEILQSHFGVTSPDQRLQRPEYLGGGSTILGVTPVPQTSESGTTKQGHLAAVGYHSQSGVGFVKSFVEHSVIIGLVSVRADLTYQQGVDRMWHRQTKHDFYFPALAHLGEQSVLNKEIFADNSATDDAVFGYQERWAEYRYKKSLITGKLLSADPQSLDVWHLSQDFAALPTLNSSFIEENPPVSRVVAVTDEPEIIFDGYFDLTCTRPMPVYSIPGLIDHF